jgi:multidrug efflux pump
MPKGFFPEQDTGLILGVAEAAPDTSFAAMADRIQALGHIVMADPDVDDVYYWIGPNPTVSQGRMMINLKPRNDRAASARQIIARLKPRLVQVQGISLFMQVRQDIQIGGRPSKTQYQYTLQDGNSDELVRWAPVFEQKLKSLPQLQDLTADTQASAPRATLRIDRDTASRLGITPEAIDDTLYDAFVSGKSPRSSHSSTNITSCSSSIRSSSWTPARYGTSMFAPLPASSCRSAHLLGSRIRSHRSPSIIKRCFRR